MADSSAGEDAKVGAQIGLLMGVLFTLWAVAVNVLGGGDVLARKGVTLGGLAAVYVAGGGLAGAIAGLLRPLTARRPGAMLVGMVAAFPVACGFTLLKAGRPDHWGHREWFVVALFSGLMGAVGGAVIWGAAREGP